MELMPLIRVSGSLQGYKSFFWFVCIGIPDGWRVRPRTGY
jgi:hypothetical protein